MRESGVWTYGFVNLVHILAIASLFGSVLVLDLRLLGVWNSIALPAVSRPAVPVATAGFGVAATTGVCLLATKATEYVGNPFLYIKFCAIGIPCPFSRRDFQLAFVSTGRFSGTEARRHQP